MPPSSRNPRPIRYYSKLVETYIQLSLYEEAEATATRILTVDPSNLVVRLKRGHARRRIGNFVASLADFETVLAVPPKPDTAEVLHFDEALRQRDIVVDVLGTSFKDLASAPEHESEISKYLEPRFTDTPQSPDEDNTLEEAQYTTNCRFHNHLGCRRGDKCNFSHAVDNKSVRDDRGKNVCLYFLVGKCKWDMFTCIYSHSKDDLPSEYEVNGKSRPSWWEDPLRVEAVREHIQRRDAKRRAQHDQNELARQRNGKKSKKKKNGRDAKASSEPPASSSSHSGDGETLVFDWESDSDAEEPQEQPDDDDFDGLEVDMGLLSFGVKPWEHEDTKEIVVALDPS